MTGLTGGLTYGFKVRAINDIKESLFSDSQYFVIANLPGVPPSAPLLETATETSITVAWSPPASNGGTPITGYRLYMIDHSIGDWVMVYDGSF